MMTCEKCYRRVFDGHVCNGDPRDTCSIFGCGRPKVDEGIVEIYGDGRRACLGRCEQHPYSDEAA